MEGGAVFCLTKVFDVAFEFETWGLASDAAGFLTTELDGVLELLRSGRGNPLLVCKGTTDWRREPDRAGMEVDIFLDVELNRGIGVAFGERAARPEVETEDIDLPLTLLWVLDTDALDNPRGFGFGLRTDEDTDEDTDARDVVRDTRVDVSDGVPREAIDITMFVC